MWLCYSLGVRKGLKTALESHISSCPIREQSKEIKHFPSFQTEHSEEIEKKNSDSKENLPTSQENTTNTDENTNLKDSADKSNDNNRQSFTYLHGRNHRNSHENRDQSSQENTNNENNFYTQNTRQSIPINYEGSHGTERLDPEGRSRPSTEINLDNVDYHIFSFTVEDFDKEFKSEFNDFIQKLGSSEATSDSYVFTIQMQDEEGAIYNVYKNDGYEYVSQFQSNSLPQLSDKSFHAIDKKAFPADSKKIIIKPDSSPNIDFLYQAYLSDLHRQPAFVSNENYTLFKISPDFFILQHKI